MASNTPNLGLYKKDPLTDGNNYFDVQTMLNDNFDKIDADKKVQDDVLASHLAETVTQSFAINRDVSITGDQIVTGFTKKPKRLDFRISIYGTKKMSIGTWAQNGTIAIGINGEGNSISSYNAIIIEDSVGNYSVAGVTVNDDKTITLNWSKFGTGGTGNAVIHIVAHYHGGA